VPTVHHAIDVAAPPEECWRVLADLAGWPRWFPLLQRAHSHAGLQLGGDLTLDFRVNRVPVSVRAVVHELEPGERVRWIGGGFGIRGNHAFTLAVRAPGLTRVTSHEEFSGWGTRLLTAGILARLDDEVHRSLGRFKAVVEAAI
jgi:uncharacterized protein YndB with AHSA1/START domain